MFFVFIPDSLHQSRESVKIGPHPRGCPSSAARVLASSRIIELWFEAW
jgi:hypothetical protein